MKKLIAALALTAAAATAPAFAGNVGISISVGEPGFYGQIDIGGYGRPGLIYSQPVVLAPRYRAYAPVCTSVRRATTTATGVAAAAAQTPARAPCISCVTSGTAMCTRRVIDRTTTCATAAMTAGATSRTIATTAGTTTTIAATTAATIAMIAAMTATTGAIVTEPAGVAPPPIDRQRVVIRQPVCFHAQNNSRGSA